ncbi:MAG TPA: hypothetical protein VLV54_04865 [Thermoanaerobaculia bacterium]|nr:hypothetical protein [Thermoanaerobaculia bacterium]
MNKRMLYLLSALLILVFSGGLAGAAPLKPQPQPKPNQRSRPVKLLTGTFVNPAGRVHRIEVVDGGHINIKNSQENLYYRLYAKKGDEGTAEVTVKQYLDAEYTVVVNEERMDVPLGGGIAKRFSVAPFGLTLDGERRTRAEYRPGLPPTLDKSVGGACCIDCGDGWIICCGVEIFEPGWIACCQIDTSCATCTVCAWWLEI